MNREFVTGRVYNDALKKIRIVLGLKSVDLVRIWGETGRGFSKSEIHGFMKSDSDKNFVPLFYDPFLDFLDVLADEKISVKISA